MIRLRVDLAGFRSGWTAASGTVHALAVSSFVNRIGTLVVPFMAFYLSADRGLSAGRVGAYLSVYGFGALLGGVLGGSAADRLTARDALGVAQLTSAVAAVGLAAAHDPRLVLAALAVFGAASQAGRAPFGALIAAAVPGERRLGAFQLLGWVGTAGILIASAFGALSVRYLGYPTLFLVDGATTLAAALIVRRAIPAPSPDPAPAGSADGSAAELTAGPTAGPAARTAAGPSAAPEARAAAWLDPLLLSTTALAFVGSVLLVQAQVTLPVSMHADGLSATAFGVLIVVNGLVMIVLQAPLHLMTRRLPLAVAAGACTWVLGSGLGLTAFAHGQFSYLATALVWSVGETPLQGLTATVPANIAPSTMRGRYQGVATLAPNGAAAVGPLLGGLGLEALGRGAFWGGCALLGFLAAVGYGMVSRQVDRRSHQLAVAAP